METNGVTVIGVCPSCMVSYYRSKTPIRTKEDCAPSNFEGLNGAGVPQEGQLPQCPQCGGLVKFVQEGQVPAESLDTPREGPSLKNELPYPSVEVLFEIGPGEILSKVESAKGGGYLVVTNKRIVRIQA